MKGTTTIRMARFTMAIGAPVKPFTIRTLRGIHTDAMKVVIFAKKTRRDITISKASDMIADMPRTVMTVMNSVKNATRSAEAPMK